MNTLFKPIPGYQGRYSASRMGKIFSHLYNIFLEEGIVDQYYNVVALHDGVNPQKTFSVDHLIALTFIGPAPADRPVILHLDGDTLNNAASNLMYGDSITKKHWPYLMGKVQPLNLKVGVRHKPAPGFEPFYLLSENGEVYSLFEQRYLSVNKSGRIKIFTEDINVAQMVLLAFGEAPPHPDFKPGFKDRNRTNLNIDNLFWKPRLKQYIKKKRYHGVIQTEPESHKVVAEFETFKAASEATGYSLTTLYNYSSLNKSIGGYFFKRKMIKASKSKA